MNDTKSCSSCFSTIDSRARRCASCGAAQPGQPFAREPNAKVIAGVCTALAQRLGIDVVLVRMLAVLSVAVTGSVVLWAYLLLWALTPLGDRAASPLQRVANALASMFGSAPSAPRAESRQELSTTVVR